MFTKDKEFGMFTDAGEDMLYDFVKFANKYQLNDKSVTAILWALSENEVFAEASDTAVREQVFASLTQGTL